MFIQKVIKNFFRDLSIRKKVLLITTAVTAVSLTLISVLFISYYLHIARQHSINQLNTSLTFLSRIANQTLIYDNKRLADEQMELLPQHNTSIELVCLYNEYNEIYSYYRKNDTHVCPNEPKVFLKANVISNISTIQPVFYLSHKVGYIYAEVNQDEVINNIRRYISFVLIVVIFMLILSFLSLLSLNPTLLTPLLTLNRNVLKIIKNRDYIIDISEYSKDEVGQLARAFEKMVTEIAKRDAELSTLNTELGKRVKERTEQLEKQTIHLEKALKSRDLFISSLSHEIRTPLNAVTNYISFLHDDWDHLDEETKKGFVLKLHRSSDRLLGLVTVLLELTHLRNGEISLNKEPICISKLIKSLLEEYSDLAEAKNRIQYIQDANIPMTDCDNKRITQVIYNLISNSLRYAPEGPIVINLSFSTEERPTLLFTIADEGVGIPDKETKDIFQPFFQSSYTNNNAGGTGIGLSICKEIIHAHDGKIWVEKNGTQGSIFCFTLPH